MRILLSLFLFILGFGISLGSTDNPPPAPSAGIIVLRAVAGYNAATVSFVSIQWVNTNGGCVTDQAGAKTVFLNEAIGKIIYFDQAFYDEVDHNQNWLDWRAGIQNREIVLPPIGSIHLTPADLPHLQAEEAVLEDIVQRFSMSDSLVTPLTVPVKDAITKLNSGLVLQNGKWMTQQEANAPVAVPVVGEAEKTVTFTTKDGKQYANVTITPTDRGLSVLTPDGGGTFVRYDQLSDDLSPFPGNISAQIRAWKTAHPAPTPSPPVVEAEPSPPPPTGFLARSLFYIHKAIDLVREIVNFIQVYCFPPPPGPVAAVAPASSSPANPPPDMESGVVLIKGDSGEGTGFLAQTTHGPVVITNLHVIAANPNLKILLPNGEEIKPLSLQGASDRDLAMFAIQDNHYSYLELASNVGDAAAVGDATVIPGNSEGGEVTLKTNGSLVGIGPQRIEINNPIYHGNSGSPIFDIKSGKVVAVVAMGTEMRPNDDLDRASFASANSAIKGSIRYFGYRLDTVPSWEPYDQRRFVDETLMLKAIHQKSCALDASMNGSINDGAKVPDEPPDTTYYSTLEKIRPTAEKWHNAVEGAEKQSALRELVWMLGTVANEDVSAIQNPGSLYTYDQPRAKFELGYRDAIKKEIERLTTTINNNSTPTMGL